MNRIITEVDKDNKVITLSLDGAKFIIQRNPMEDNYIVIVVNSNSVLEDILASNTPNSFIDIFAETFIKSKFRNEFCKKYKTINKDLFNL